MNEEEICFIPGGVLSKEDHVNDFSRVHYLREQIDNDLADIHKTLKELTVTTYAGRKAMVKEFKESIILQAVLEYIDNKLLK